jgi:hypothetical protein
MPVQVLNPDELPAHAPLWRYMKLSTFFLLLRGSAFFPSVTTLRAHDPMEGSLYPDGPWLIHRISELGGEDGAGAVDDWLESKASEFERTLWQSNRENPFTGTRMRTEIYARELSRRRAIWCWFNSDIESAAMWSIYADRGIAIGTTVSALAEALPEDRDFQVARILYASRQPSSPHWFNPESAEGDPRIHRPHLVKGREYLHECEIRVTTRCCGDARGTLINGIAQSLNQEIVISPLVPFEEAQTIKHFIHLSDLPTDIPVRRSSILGTRADEDEMHAEMDTRLAALFPQDGAEAGLPPIVATL